MEFRKLIIYFFFLTICCCGIIKSTSFSDATNDSSSDSTNTNSLRANKTKLGQDLKKIEDILTFKNFFHHDDSIRLAKQYINEQQKLLKERRDYPYDLDYTSSGLNVSAYEPSVNFDLDYEVIGWYPNWEKNLYKHLNYSLLSTVAYFSYELNPKTGKAITTNDWETSPLIDSVKTNGKTILLTVTNFGTKNNRKFLKNTDAINTLIEELKSLLNKRNGDGICLDFEGVKKSEKNDYSKFILLLSQELKAANKDYLLYMAVPSVDFEKSLDFETIIPVVDRFLIMGYGYYGPTSKVAGPVAPLNSGKIWEPYNLSTSVDYYLASGVPNSKLILTLPYYGTIWETENGNKGSKVKKFIGSRTYDYIKANINVPIQYDSVSQSAWCSYAVNDEKTQFRQCWFDNDSSLTVKLNYIKSKKLKGMGMWALGYDKGYHDLWKVIATNLVKTDSTTTDNNSDQANTENGNNGGNENGSGGESSGNDTGTDDDSIWKQIVDVVSSVQNVTEYKNFLLLILLFVVVFGGTGFVISMFQPNTRVYFFGTTSYAIYYAAFVLLFIIVASRLSDAITDLSVAIIFGFILGAIALYFINKYIQKTNNNIP
ncbi:MAG: glycoside hydrolase family 18 protein [Cellulophaga sp.]